MFSNCSVLTEFYFDQCSFNTENVKDMSYMFYNCYKLNNISFPLFDAYNVINMDSMFCNCINLNGVFNHLSSYKLKI